MATRPSPENLWDMVRDQQRRLHALETGSRVGKASIPSGGALVVLNSAGTPVMRIGTLLSGGYGIERWSGAAWEAYAVPDSDWKIPTFVGSWANYSSGYAGARFRKLANGQVEIQGLVANGVGGSVIFVLPVGFRPNARLLFSSNSDGTAPARIDVATDGSVIHQAGGTAYISINVTFFAEQ